MKTMLNTQKTNSKNNNIRNMIAGLATFAMLAYVPNALAAPQKSEPQKKQQQVVKKEMPGLQFKVTDQQGNTLEKWTKLTENHILFPPFTVPYGGSFSISYQDGSIVHDNIKLDLLIMSIDGKYLTNPQQIRGLGQRAFPTEVNTIQAGMQPDRFYAIYASKEKAGSLTIKEVGIKPSKEILASAMALLYVQGTCPPPEIREVVKEVEVFRTLPPAIVQMPSERAEPIKEKCKGGNIIMINPFYTGKGNWGGDLAFNFKITRDLGLGLGVFYQPGRNRTFITNIQHDEYTVEDRILIGETKLISTGNMDIKGVLANILLGKPCKVRLGLEGGVGWANYQLKNSFEQTVKVADTGELIDEFVCNGGSLDVKKMIYRVGGMLVMPLSDDKVYAFVKGGVFINLPNTADVHFSTGNINQTISLGPKRDWYLGAGLGVDF